MAVVYQEVGERVLIGLSINTNESINLADSTFSGLLAE